MDGIFDKLGIYELFTTFISGLIFLTGCICSGIPTQLFFPEGFESLTVYFFLIISYFCGIILQGLGSFYEKKQKKYNFISRARETYFTVPGVFKDEEECSQFKEPIREILKNHFGTCPFCEPSEIDLKNAFQHCIVTLEANQKNWKVEKIGAKYGLYRSMMAGSAVLSFSHFLLLLLSVHGCTVAGYQCSVFGAILRCIFFFALMYFFGYRAISEAEYRVRTVLRHYKMLYHDTRSSNDEETSTTACAGSAQ